MLKKVIFNYLLCKKFLSDPYEACRMIGYTGP